MTHKQVIKETDAYYNQVKDFTRQDIKSRADRIGKGSEDMGWFTFILILLFASLIAGALSALIF